MTKLTDQYLLENGYEQSYSIHTYDEKLPEDIVYRKQFTDYPFQIQVALGEYLETNPNCGIVSIYDPEITDCPFPTEDNFEATGTLEAMEQPIAWCVNTVERLEKIVDALIETN